MFLTSKTLLRERAFSEEKNISEQSERERKKEREREREKRVISDF